MMTPPNSYRDLDPFRVILVGNYAPDDQPSMQRFAGMLHDGLTRRNVDVALVTPPVVMRRGAAWPFSKWLGYVDKLVLFPRQLRRTAARSRARLLVHLCDHGNAFYVPYIERIPHVVTCHDLIALRAALGEFPGRRPRWSGRQLQRAIRVGLQAARCVVCDSNATRDDLDRIVKPCEIAPAMIPPGVSSVFAPLAPETAWPRVRRLLTLSAVTTSPSARPSAVETRVPYLLHVGGNQWYKNRPGLIEIYAALVDRFAGVPDLLLAGKQPDAHLLACIARHRLADRIRLLTPADDDDLAALYACAALLIFPSLAEGFGWPVLEAMACGCRVVASQISPLIAVAGEAATYIDPTHPRAAAALVASALEEPADARQARVAAGLSRAARFTTDAMVDAYLAVYRHELARWPAMHEAMHVPA